MDTKMDAFKWLIRLRSRAAILAGLLAVLAACPGCVTNMLVDTTRSHSHLEPSPLWFSANDILDADALARKLQTGADPVSAFLGQNLRPAERRHMEAYQAGTETTNQFREAMAQTLNDSIGRLDIYNSNRFQNITLRPQTKALFGIAGGQVGLHRHLLEDAYPMELAKAPDPRMVVDKQGRPANYVLLPLAVAADVALVPFYAVAVVWYVTIFSASPNHC